MALYWPDQKVALQIDDDPLSKPYEGPDDWHVFHTTKAMLDDFDTFDALMAGLAEALGEPHPDPRLRRERRSLFEALSHADAHANSSSDDEDDDNHILDLETGEMETWDGPLPDGAFETIEGGFNMITPEFFFFREARRRTLLQEMQLAYELCGFYGTLAEHGSCYHVYSSPVTTVDELRTFLGGVHGRDGYRLAMDALNYVAEGSASPAATYLSILLTTPRRQGGYDLMRPKLTMCFSGLFGEEKAPTEEGRYEAYDLCWPHQRVALQFVGDSLPSARERRALEAPGLADMFVVYVTQRQMADPEAFDVAARLLAERLGTPLPPSDAAFVSARDKAREELTFPAYDHMRTMVEDWHWHEQVF